MSVMYFRSSRSVIARTTPASSITSLRAVLTSVAPLGIDISSSYPIEPRVWAVAGICSDRKSAAS